MDKPKNEDIAYLATEMMEALAAAEKADDIHSNCEDCMENAQAAEACGECFPSADDARVLRRNVLAKVILATRRAATRV